MSALRRAETAERWCEVTSLNHTIRRKLPVSFDRSEWVAEINPTTIQVRRLRSRKEVFTIGWDAVIATAIRIHVESERRSKREARKARTRC